MPEVATPPPRTRRAWTGLPVRALVTATSHGDAGDAPPTARSPPQEIANRIPGQQRDRGEVRGEALADAARVQAHAGRADDPAVLVDSHAGVRPRGSGPGRAPRRSRRERLVQPRGRRADAGGDVALALERRDERRVDEAAAARAGAADGKGEVPQEGRRGHRPPGVGVEPAERAVGPEAGERRLDVLEDRADRGGVAFELGL